MNHFWRRSAVTTASFVIGSDFLNRSFGVNNANNRTLCQSDSNAADPGRSPRLVFLGTGSSTGCPKPICTLLFQPNHEKDGSMDAEIKALRKQYAPVCQTSQLAMKGYPIENKNYRNNPSLLIGHTNAEGKPVNIIIDVGKTFRETAIRWFPTHNIQSLDAVILTHHHMDAVAGLDDLRGFQKITGIDSLMSKSNRKKITPDLKRVPLPVFMSQECLDNTSSQFPYLFPKQSTPTNNASSDNNKPKVKRDVAALDVHVVQDFKPFIASGLQVIPLPVLHGDDLVCLGFAFSITNKVTGLETNVVYLSDISKMIPETLHFIENKLPKTDLLVLDTLNRERPHPVHFNLPQAIDLARTINPRQRTYLVGMNCDSFPDHDEMNKELSKLDIDIQFAHDGLEIQL